MNSNINSFFFNFFSLLAIFFITQNINAIQLHDKLTSAKDDFKCKVDFETHNGSIYLKNIKIKKSNINCKFLLDNGCSETFISESLAEQLNIKTLGKKVIYDFTGTKRKLPYGRTDYIISNVIFKNIKTIILPDDSFQSDGCNVNGIIGRNLMKQCVWNISYDKGIFISNNIESYSLNNYNKQHLYLTEGVRCSFAGGDSSVLAMLDLGSQSLLVVNPNFLNQVGKIQKNKILSYSTVFEGIFTDTLCKNQEVKLSTDEALIEGFSFSQGTDLLKKPIITIDKNGLNTPTVGNMILNYYDIVLDIKNRMFYFHNIKSDYTYKKQLGLGFSLKDNIITIDYLVKNSPADKAGILIDDEITEINHKSIRNIINEGQKCQYYDLIWKELDKNKGVFLKIKNNKETIYINRAYLFSKMN